MDDERIVSLYWQRDEAAIGCTEKKYSRYLLKIAYNILADLEDSNESVNDTYLAAWNAMPPHRPKQLSTFLGKLTRRISIDRLRKKHSAKRGGSQYALSLSELTQCLPGGTDPEQQTQAKELTSSIERFLLSCPEKTRNVFLGRYYYLDPIREVARYCGLTEANTKTLLHRTRNALRAHLEQEGFL